jgi:hypothetical protein
MITEHQANYSGLGINIEQNFAIAVTAVFLEMSQAGVNIYATHFAHYGLRATMVMLASVLDHHQQKLVGKSVPAWAVRCENFNLINVCHGFPRCLFELSEATAISLWLLRCLCVVAFGCASFDPAIDFGFEPIVAAQQPHSLGPQPHCRSFRCWAF